MMMDKYARSAVEAANLCSREKDISPRIAWDQVTSLQFGKGTPSQKKGCPRDAFLGLCEEGCVKNIPSGKYCNSRKNKNYALTAFELLTEEPDLANQSPIFLWKRVMISEPKHHNSQMDVVIALWKNGLLIQPRGT
jgi:hypothetical protein